MGQSASKDAKKDKARRHTDAIPFADDSNKLSLVNNNYSSLVDQNARSATNSFAGGGGDLASSQYVMNEEDSL